MASAPTLGAVFNVGGQEFLVILLLALLVLGPERLPGAIRTVGRVVGELRRISGGFQNELRDALAEPLASVQEIRNSVQDVAANFQHAITQAANAPDPSVSAPPEVPNSPAASDPVPTDALASDAAPDDQVPSDTVLEDALPEGSVLAPDGAPPVPPVTLAEHPLPEEVDGDRMPDEAPDRP
ncbi:MAG: tatB [Acidimicrobiia bacterium]|nr:tatB [Acidimicrobiia bacterium]